MLAIKFKLVALNKRVERPAYHLKILNDVMKWVKKLIAMSLLPKQVLEQILNSVAQMQTTSMAIPPTQILTYYETKLFFMVAGDEFGIIFGLALSFASGSTALNWYRAILIPMPTNESDDYASEYETEAIFIAIAKSTRRSVLLSLHEIKNCSGCSSSWYVLMVFR